MAVFFGLSGTGKTTLSADPDRTLIGDDELGWSDDGVFNFEGGCYAKMIRLSPEGDRKSTTRRAVSGPFGKRRHRRPNSSTSISTTPRSTENTRAAYPISHIPEYDAHRCGRASQEHHHAHCDAFGVLPPLARMTPEQAMYHFLAGYTAKVAGTEAGVTEPEATFSPCFGGPFMALPPLTYAQLLGK